MKLLATLLLALTLTGCASVNSFFKENSTTAQVTVQYATLKVIERSDKINRDDVLEKVRLARDLITQDTEVTFRQLSAKVREAINWDRLDDADQILLDAVLQEAETRLQERIGEGVLDEDSKTTLVTLFNWIEQAASLAGD